MSLSFQDLFPGEDDEMGGRAESDLERNGSVDQPNPAMDDNRAVFSKPSRTFEKPPEEDRKYLVSELLPFIPPAIAAQSGIPMELEVSIPMPADGSGEVKLSTIYHACPKLFAAEITPLNDSEVTLPVKIGGFSSEGQFASSPFVPGKAFGAKSAPESHSPSTPEKDNPFWSPVSESEVDEPEREVEQSAPEKPAREAEKAGAEPAHKFGGFDEPFSPPTEKTKSQSEPDPVESGFSGKPFGSDESFFTLFSNEEREEKNEEVANDEEDSEPATNWGSMFQAPEREPAQSGKDSAEEEADDFSPESEGPIREPAEKAIAKPWTPVGFEEPKNSPDPVSESKPENTFKSEPDSEPAKAEPAPKFEPIKVERKEAPKPEIEWTSAPAPVEPAITEKQPTPLSRMIREPQEDDLADVELRAIFSTSERFTFSKLARKVVGLPGIASCALSGAGKVVQASKSEENQLGTDAQDMVSAVRNIAKMTGMDAARSFTMKTEFGVVSLFLEGDCCLSVNHEEGEFGPGIREKLIVIARSLHKLAD